MSDFETVWEFRTKQFRVALEIWPEDMDPADSFEFQEDIDAVRTGAVEWFQATVSVYYVEPNGASVSTRLAGVPMRRCANSTPRTATRTR